MMDKLKTIIKAINEEHPEMKALDTAMFRFLESCEDKTQFVESLQETCNKLYERYGLDDNILELQILINEYRNEYDITDPREIIHTDNGRGFVQ